MELIESAYILTHRTNCITKREYDYRNGDYYGGEITMRQAKQLYDKLSPFWVVPRWWKSITHFKWIGLKVDETMRHLNFEEFCGVLQKKFKMEVVE